MHTFIQYRHTHKGRAQSYTRTQQIVGFSVIDIVGSARYYVGTHDMIQWVNIHRQYTIQMYRENSIDICMIMNGLQYLFLGPHNLLDITTQSEDISKRKKNCACTTGTGVAECIDIPWIIDNLLCYKCTCSKQINGWLKAIRDRASVDITVSCLLVFDVDTVLCIFYLESFQFTFFGRAPFFFSSSWVLRNWPQTVNDWSKPLICPYLMFSRHRTCLSPCVTRLGFNK